LLRLKLTEAGNRGEEEDGVNFVHGENETTLPRRLVNRPFGMIGCMYPFRTSQSA
jgi:hypothetical protein